MNREITLGEKLVGEGHPTYIVAEIGINLTPLMLVQVGNKGNAGASATCCKRSTDA